MARRANNQENILQQQQQQASNNNLYLFLIFNHHVCCAVLFIPYPRPLAQRFSIFISVKRLARHQMCGMAKQRRHKGIIIISNRT